MKNGHNNKQYISLLFDVKPRTQSRIVKLNNRLYGFSESFKALWSAAAVDSIP